MKKYYETPKTDWLEIELTKTGLISSAVFVDQPNTVHKVPAGTRNALDDYFYRGVPLPTTLYTFPDHLPPFTKQILRVIELVPFGQTITYTELAKQAGNPAAVRAAGTACGRNPIALFIPCHRVVRKTNEDLGYSWGPKRKRWLLEHEGVQL